MMIIRTMPAAKFKAQLNIMDDVRATREPVVITKKGRPVATAGDSIAPPTLAMPTRKPKITG